MLRELIGKEVTMIVGFSIFGSSASRYIGKILDIQNDLIKMDVKSFESTMGLKAKQNGICIVNAKYIMSVFENQG